MNRPFATFSGGNQQKILFARWLRRSPKILLLDEPTNGVDLGARASLHHEVLRAAEDGAAVIIGSSDVDELVALCHRVLVFRDGCVATELSGDSVTVARVTAECLGLSEERFMAVERVVQMTQTRAEVSREVQSVERPSASVPVGQRVKSVVGFHRISGAYLLLVIIITFGIWIPELFLTQSDVALDRVESGHHGDPCPWCARAVVDWSDRHLDRREREPRGGGRHVVAD